MAIEGPNATQATSDDFLPVVRRGTNYERADLIALCDKVHAGSGAELAEPFLRGDANQFFLVFQLLGENISLALAITRNPTWVIAEVFADPTTATSESTVAAAKELLAEMGRYLAKDNIGGSLVVRFLTTINPLAARLEKLGILGPELYRAHVCHFDDSGRLHRVT